MTWWNLHLISQHRAMRTWTEVPATIKSAELKNSGKKKRSKRAVAIYEYQFGGRTYTGERVSLHSGADNIGRFQQEAYQELKQHLDQQKPFRCFVNPEKPSSSVLYRNVRGEMLGFTTLFATLFGSVGLGMLTGGLLAARYSPKVDPSRASSDQPWLARDDWASGLIRPSMGTTVVTATMSVVTLYWCIASAPLVWMFPEIVRQDKLGEWKWLLLVFPAIGVLLVGLVIRQLARSRKFGESVLQLASTPGVVGGQLAGVVRIPKLIMPADGFRLQLSCLMLCKGRNNKEQEEVVWQDEQIVTAPMHDQLGDQTAIPVLFAIPFEARETAAARTRWRLEASARMPGVDYASQFEVPVFRTEASRADFRVDENLAAQYSVPPSRDALLREVGLLKETLPSGGVQIVFPAARNWPSAVPITAILLVLCGVYYVVGPKSMPWMLQGVLGLFVLFLLWMALDLWFYRSVVTADANELTSRGGLLGLGSTRSLPAGEVKEITTSDYMSSGTNVWKSIDVVSRGDEKWTIGRGINGKLAQQAVIDELREALRLQ